MNPSLRTLLYCLLLPLYMLSAQGMDAQIQKAKNKVFPALVHIQPVKEIYSGGEKQKMQVTGSGVIISADGYLVTNNHVAEKARYVRCTLSSRQEVTARVIGLDPWTDLAVLKLDLEKAGLDEVPYASFGNSRDVDVGQVVMALGSPLGLSRSLSMGVISSVDRYFEDMGDMISPFNLWLQTDAAINPGNSGGPLINLKGEIIGINARAVVFGENLGFAIPSNIVRFVVRQILEKGAVERSYIGVKWQEIGKYRKYVKRKELEGVLVASVDKNSPAEKAGIRAGDLVTAIMGRPVSAVYREELPRIRLLIANQKTGLPLKLNMIRNGAPMSLTVITGEQGKFQGTEFNAREWGLSLEELTPRLLKIFQLESGAGVVVSGVKSGSPADKADMRRGDIITLFDGKAVNDLETFKQYYSEAVSDSTRSVMLMLRIKKRNRFALIEGKKN